MCIRDRLTSVLAKLTREPTMKLSQMQDLGGCRAILSSIESVKRLASFYRNPIRGEQGQSKCYDYIENPKPDGYRGIHIVGRYRARITNNDIWNGQRIEIQLRTKLQHAFATAVETVATFTRSGLKSVSYTHLDVYKRQDRRGLKIQDNKKTYRSEGVKNSRQ